MNWKGRRSLLLLVSPREALHTSKYYKIQQELLFIVCVSEEKGRVFPTQFHFIFIADTITPILLMRKLRHGEVE